MFTDEKNKCGLKNYKGFVQNRHNQSVLSILSKKMNIQAYRDPTEYGTHPGLYKSFKIPDYTFNIKKYDKSDYPQILVQHRSGKVTTKTKLMGFIRTFLPYYLSGIILKIIYCVKRR